MKTAYIDCDTCAHCVDFHTPTDDQPEQLTIAQNAVADEVAVWLSDAALKREAEANATQEAEANWEDIDYEQKRLDLDEVIVPGDGSTIFLQ